MAFNPKSLVLSKLSIILSSTLAHNNSGRLEWVWGGEFKPNVTDFNSSCADPCADLNNSIQGEALVLAPTAIVVLFSLAAILPTLVTKSKNKVLGIKSYLWVLLQLWVYLLVAHYLYTTRKDRAQAYVWALHSTSHVLSSWSPKRGSAVVMKHPTLHCALTTLGAACVSLFAWQVGPGVGLAAWYSKGDALCGWSVHLIAVLGVELAQWVLSPVEVLLTRM
jgi:hypothetical protein